MKSFLQPEITKFGKILSDFTKESDDFMQMIENINSKELDNILLYLFEKSAFLYFENAETIKDKSLKEEKFKKFSETSDSSDIIYNEPLNILKNCIKYLQIILKKDDVESKNKNMKKLFCLAYIRVYIYKFAYILNKSQRKKDYEEIIKVIDGEPKNKLNFMIRLYFYKLIYNINGANIEEMRKTEIKEKFYLDKFNNYEKFINSKCDTFLFVLLLPKEKNEISKFENLFIKMRAYQEENFENIDVNTFNEDSDKDLLYIVLADIYSYLVFNSNQKIKTNFYNNIIDKIFSDDEKTLLKTVFDPKEYSYINDKFDLQNYINIIEIILYSLRFCLKTWIFSDDYCIYKKLLSFDISYIRNSYLIGNDISENNYYDIYSKLIEHFQKNSKNSGAYVCLCKKGFYQYIPPDGYPTEENKDEQCNYCFEKIGALTETSFKHWYSYALDYKFCPVKRDGYVRIFKDEKDIEKEPKDKLNSINYMTLEKFKKNKIDPLFRIEQNGISQVSAEHFKKENKQIRFLTNQISYRLLNFILYSHLFFAEIMNGKKIKQFFPKNMNIIDVLQEDWDLLKNALKDKDIKIFINLVFKDLTDEMVKIGKIEKIEELFKIEKKLDDIINKSLKEYNDYKQNSYEINYKIKKYELNSALYLLNEYNNHSLNNEDYPFYKYFLYTNYVLENNIKSNEKYSQYIVLNNYLNKDKYDDKIKYLKTLDIFNRFNNLILDTYSNRITKEEAEQIKIEELKKGDNFEERRPLYEEYFKAIKTIDKGLILRKEDPISKFLIIKNSDEGKKLIGIYKRYIKAQNDLINEIVREKHYQKDLPIPEKINVQIIKKEEIFSFDLGKTCLTEIIFENSNRNNNFKDIIVNYEKIEEKLTEILLKNKKLLNDNITYFVFKNEIITPNYNEFIKNYMPLKELTNDEKIKIKNYYEDRINNIEQWINIINDFDKIILTLNEEFKSKKMQETETPKDETSKTSKLENDNNIEEEKNKKIKDIKNFNRSKSNNIYSYEFDELLDFDDNFTLNKIINIFLFSEKIMFVNILKKELAKYSKSKELDKKIKKEIDEIYKDKDLLITKEVLTNAIRRYLSRYLIREKNKDKIMQGNPRNFIYYLNIEDIWDNEINDNDSQKQKEIKKLENINITIEQILSLYDYLEGDNFIYNELNELKKEKNSQNNKIITDSDEILKEEEEKENDDNLNDYSNNEESEQENDSSDNNNPDSDRE